MKPIPVHNRLPCSSKQPAGVTLIGCEHPYRTRRKHAEALLKRENRFLDRHAPQVQQHSLREL